MAPPLLPDDVWEKVRSLFPLPKARRSRYPGRLPLEDRKVLTGILFVLKMEIRWNDLPPELGCGSGSRCRRRLQEWNYSGVWRQIHPILLTELPNASQINWKRAMLDGSPDGGSRRRRNRPRQEPGPDPPPAKSIPIQKSIGSKTRSRGKKRSVATRKTPRRQNKANRSPASRR